MHPHLLELFGTLSPRTPLSILIGYRLTSVSRHLRAQVRHLQKFSLPKSPCPVNASLLLWLFAIGLALLPSLSVPLIRMTWIRSTAYLELSHHHLVSTVCSQTSLRGICEILSTRAVLWLAIALINTSVAQRRQACLEFKQPGEPLLRRSGWSL